MKIPKQITKEIIDEMIPVWEELAEKGWRGDDPYPGLCAHFKEYTESNEGIFAFLDSNWIHEKEVFILPDSGKEGAQKRVEILKEIRKEL